jgi:hypothetical protein
VSLREDVIHYHVRRGLKALGWTLLAGQYPNGSDDELPCLAVVDTRVARDQSPDSRRHASNKLVPDLVAVRDTDLLVIEMKPSYNSDDEQKLVKLLSSRRAEFEIAFQKLAATRRWELDISKLNVHPCLGFSAGETYECRPDFCYITVDHGHGVVLDGNGLTTSGSCR